MDTTDGSSMAAIVDDNKRKIILVMRYKMGSPSIFLHYTTFCNLIQMPAWVNIMGQHSSIGEELDTYNFHFQSPDIYDYFGIEIKKLSVRTDNTAGRYTFHRPFTHQDSVDGLAIFLEKKPHYFLIESKILSFIEDCSGDGSAKLDQQLDALLVPVIFKDNFYYICPGQENSLIYRVHHPASIFFTSKGHDALKSLIGKAFMRDNYWCYVDEINIVMPKQSKPVTNWDKKSDFVISVCVPYPVVSTNKVPDSSWCAVQTVRLNDSQYVKDVVVNYETNEVE